MNYTFIDVDGTLIDENDNVRPMIPELINTLAVNKIDITIWSAGGGMYAAEKWNMICNRLWHTTSHYLHEHVKNFSWKLDWEQRALIGKHLFIDDQTAMLEKLQSKNHGVFHVPFYSTLNENDDWLWQAAQYAERFFLNDESIRTDAGEITQMG